MSVYKILASEGSLPRTATSELIKTMGRESSRRRRSSFRMSGITVNSIFRTWTELSKINFVGNFFMSETSLPEINLSSFPDYQGPLVTWPSHLAFLTEEDFMQEKFFVNVTPLLNENQLWGCFYNFPELYEDIYSPVVQVRELKDVSKLVGGVLTRDMVTACYTYLKRTPILGDYVFIKLDLSCKHLVNIRVLQHYKFLVYLDLSSNYLTELSVLSYLLYLQFLSVSYNRLTTVLEYDIPQWFLTEVHYKYNNVKKIRDISLFWSITILDLSHNNITAINGLENLKFLRRLDLSFNHIQRIENLDSLVIVWLDLSYNNISSFAFGSTTGLWTLLHLEYLNLNENKLTCMKVFCGCLRLRELHARNNRLMNLMELAVYMRQLRQLSILDLRENPVCATACYKDVIINTFPLLLSLDEEALDPVEQQSTKSRFFPDVFSSASRKLLRLLYIQQLGRATVSQFDPPADTQDVPIVVLVGLEAVGRGCLKRRLVLELNKHVEIAYQHTTSTHHFTGHFIEVTRDVFDEMLVNGEFLTYTEMESESYGLSREEACVKGGKVKIVSLDLCSALMLKKRGLRPYIILANCFDKEALYERQMQRKERRATSRLSQDISRLMNIFDKSALQTLLSGRILIRGILNDIVLSMPVDTKTSDEETPKWFQIQSDWNQFTEDSSDFNRMKLMNSDYVSDSDLVISGGSGSKPHDTSLHSLYKQSQTTDEYDTSAAGPPSFQESKRSDEKNRPARAAKSRGSIDFTRYVSTTWQGGVAQQPAADRTSKSVTFTSQEDVPTVRSDNITPNTSPIVTELKSGLLIEPPIAIPSRCADQKLQSISTKVIHKLKSHGKDVDDLDFWLSFLDETGLLRISDPNAVGTEEVLPRTDTYTPEDQNFILKQLEHYFKMPHYGFNRWDYEEINRDHPGLFWDTINMDEPEEAFKKMKTIIKDIINSQKKLKPMFDIDFTSDKYPPIQKRLKKICKEITPVRLFH